jgi:uncharacterized protein YecE (DUF72 family)
MKKLKDPQEALDTFLNRIALLKDRLGAILFQLPPRWKCNPDRLRGFLDLLPSNFRYTFEFRDDSWWNDEVYQLLRDKGSAFCLFDLNGRESPRKITADFLYIRLHGPGGPYQGRYGPAALAGWADAITAWQRSGIDVFCYFDNDERGFAADDALALSSILQND